MIWLSLYLYLSMSMCHGYHVEGSCRVVHLRANAGLLLLHPTINNITSIKHNTNIHFTTTNFTINNNTGP